MKYQASIVAGLCLAALLPASAQSRMDIEQTLRAMGVKWMRTVRTYGVGKMVATLKEAMKTAEKGLKVIIADGECQLARQRRRALAGAPYLLDLGVQRIAHRHVVERRMAGEVDGQLQIGEDAGKELALQQTRCLGIVAVRAAESRSEAGTHSSNGHSPSFAHCSGRLSSVRQTSPKSTQSLGLVNGRHTRSVIRSTFSK